MCSHTLSVGLHNRTWTLVAPSPCETRLLGVVSEVCEERLSEAEAHAAFPNINARSVLPHVGARELGELVPSAPGVGDGLPSCEPEPRPNFCDLPLLTESFLATVNRCLLDHVLRSGLDDTHPVANCGLQSLCALHRVKTCTVKRMSNTRTNIRKEAQRRKRTKTKVY